MASIDTPKLASQKNGLTKATPTEETLKKIDQMMAKSVRANNHTEISWMAHCALVYVVTYLKHRYNLSNDQIRNLSSEDLNRMPEIIFADQGKWVLLLGWIPIFGWFFAGRYLLFKGRVRYLRSLDETIFDKSRIEHILSYDLKDSLL